MKQRLPPHAVHVGPGSVQASPSVSRNWRKSPTVASFASMHVWGSIHTIPGGHVPTMPHAAPVHASAGGSPGGASGVLALSIPGVPHAVKARQAASAIVWFMPDRRSSHQEREGFHL